MVFGNNNNWSEYVLTDPRNPGKKKSNNQNKRLDNNKNWILLTYFSVGLIHHGANVLNLSLRGLTCEDSPVSAFRNVAYAISRGDRTKL